MGREERAEPNFGNVELQSGLRNLRTTCARILMDRAKLVEQPIFAAVMDSLVGRYGSYNPLDYQRFWQVSGFVETDSDKETPITVVSLGKSYPDQSSFVAIDFFPKGTYGEVVSLPLHGRGSVFAAQPYSKPVGIRPYTIRHIPREPEPADITYYQRLIEQLR